MSERGFERAPLCSLLLLPDSLTGCFSLKPPTSLSALKRPFAAATLSELLSCVTTCAYEDKCLHDAPHDEGLKALATREEGRLLHPEPSKRMTLPQLVEALETMPPYGTVIERE